MKIATKMPHLSGFIQFLCRPEHYYMFWFQLIAKFEKDFGKVGNQTVNQRVKISPSKLFGLNDTADRFPIAS